MPRYHTTPEGNIPFTPEEEIKRDNEIQAWNNKSAERKLNEIKNIRLQKLQETDYLSYSDLVMPDNIKTWRQSLRDIPANHTDEDAYDLLLEYKEDGTLKHSIWSKP